MIQRKEITDALITALIDIDFVQAVWEGGAAAFDRVDEWSDIDVAVIVKDGMEKETFQIAEDALNKVSPVELMYEFSQTPWEGHQQIFYRLKNTSKFLLVDFSIFKESAPDKLLEPEIHNRSKVHFDKTGVTKSYKLVPEIHNKKIRKQIETLRVTTEIFGVFIDKELNRGNFIEAIANYYGYSIRPLVILLRIKYSPEHYNFSIRYIHYELPGEIVERLQNLYFVGSPDDLVKKNEECRNWYFELLKSITEIYK
ncbi:hypothetical protein BH10BAC5_BH10BAC5_00390 [soil metagenome]